MSDENDEVRRKHLGELIRTARERAGLSATEAAKRARASRGSWERWERGGPGRPDMYARMEQVLGWDPGTTKKILRGELDEPLTLAPLVQDDPLIQRLVTVATGLAAPQRRHLVAMAEAFKKSVGEAPD